MKEYMIRYPELMLVNSQTSWDQTLLAFSGTHTHVADTDTDKHKYT